MAALIIVSGPVGAGKTTVARALAADATDPTIYIEGDLFWRFVVKDKPAPVRESFLAAMRAMAAAAASYTRSGYETILDFSIPPAFIERAAMRFAEIELHYVVLLPSLRTCESRAAARSEGQIGDYTAYRDFYADFSQAQTPAIENEGDDPKDVAARIRVGIRERRFLVASE